MKKRLLEKWKSTRGESLGETLASLLIISLAMTMLAASIVHASNINKKMRDYDTSFQITSPKPEETAGKVTVSNSEAESYNVTVYTTSPKSDSNSENSTASDVHYVYYEPVEDSDSNSE